MGKSPFPRTGGSCNRLEIRRKKKLKNWILIFFLSFSGTHPIYSYSSFLSLSPLFTLSPRTLVSSSQCSQQSNFILIILMKTMKSNSFNKVGMLLVLIKTGKSNFIINFLWIVEKLYNFIINKKRNTKMKSNCFVKYFAYGCNLLWNVEMLLKDLKLNQFYPTFLGCWC